MLIIKLVEKVVNYFSSIAILLLAFASVLLFMEICREEGLVGIVNTVRIDVLGVFVKFVPVIIVFFTITGAINHLAKTHPKKFEEMISGDKGTIQMVVLAAAMPGPAGGQQLQDAWNNPKVNRAKVLVALIAMMALGINTLLFRAKVLGGPLTLIWFGMAFVFMLQVWVICKYKPWLWFSQLTS